MAYKKTLNWYLSREYRPLAKKLERRINSKGTPTVKVRVQSPDIVITMPYYAQFQDKGVKGVLSGKSNAKPKKYKYKDKMPPPEAFERYTSDKGGQFLIARSIYRKGIKPKKYIDASWGFFAPQFKKANDRAVKKYLDNEVMPQGGTINL